MKAMMQATDDQVALVRDFNRVYTRQIGLLEERLLDSDFSLTEARILYELAHRTLPTAAAIGRDLGLDPGYLSRILKKFERRGLLRRLPSSDDGRQSGLSLTDEGAAAFAPVNRASQEAVAALLNHLSPGERAALMPALRRVRAAFAPASSERTYELRPHRAGDIGWITHRQGLLYQQEYGWDETYEALVAEILSAFIRSFDRGRERAWIAESEGEILGSVFLVRQSDEIAKLRLLYVEPAARGLGLGRRLVDECIGFAREAGYRTLTLWTNDVLISARRIYQAAGFRLVREEAHHSFGKALTGQHWDLELQAP